MGTGTPLDERRNGMERVVMPSSRLAAAAAAATLLVGACGSSSTGVELGDAVSTPPSTAGDAEPTTTSGADAGLASCAEIPQAGTDVLGEGGADNVDPIVLGVLQTYAAEHSDTFGGLWIDREALGTVVLAFTDDPETHRSALSDRAPSADDVRGGHTATADRRRPAARRTR